MREETARGVGLNHSFRFSVRPLPNSSGVNTASLPFWGTLMGRSARKSRRLEKKPRDSGFCAPVRRGADCPDGSVTLGGGVPGSLHLGTSVLNCTCLRQKNLLQLRFTRGTNGCPPARG